MVSKKINFFLLAVLLACATLGSKGESANQPPQTGNDEQQAIFQQTPYADTYTYEASQGNPITLTLDTTIFYIKFGPAKIWGHNTGFRIDAGIMGAFWYRNRYCPYEYMKN